MLSASGKFSRRNRLLKPDEFSRVFDDCERSGDQYFLVLGRPNDLPYARLGLAISKKKTRRAVDRNRVKRLIRESFRNHLGLVNGLDIVVLIQRFDRLVSNQQYQASLAKHWKRLDRKCARS